MTSKGTCPECSRCSQCSQRASVKVYTPDVRIVAGLPMNGARVCPEHARRAVTSGRYTYVVVLDDGARCGIE